MPNYNGSRFIAPAINSVLNQTYSNWELIIVDDKSKDESIDIIQTFVDKDIRIKLYKLDENKGVSYARNFAISKLNGRFMAFLDSDDIWLPEKLEKQLLFMTQNNFSFTYLAYEKINHNGKVIGRVNAPEKISYYDLLKTCYPGCLTVMLDINYLGEVYIPLNTKREDYALWLKLIKKTNSAFGLNQVLAQYRIHSGQSSRIKFHMAKETWNLYRDLEKLSFLKSIFYFLNYAIRGVFRTYITVIARKLNNKH